MIRLEALKGKKKQQAAKNIKKWMFALMDDAEMDETSIFESAKVFWVDEKTIVIQAVTEFGMFQLLKHEEFFEINTGAFDPFVIRVLFTSKENLLQSKLVYLDFRCRDEMNEPSNLENHKI